MEDRQVKRRLARVPDVDGNGEPIWKIETAEERMEKQRREKVPLFLRQNSGAYKGDQMDPKDETPE